MNSKVLNDLVAFAIAEASRQDRRVSLGPIHLVKYLYLADWEYAKDHGGESLTGLPWKFFHFGPYCDALEDEIEQAANQFTGGQTSYLSKKFGREFKRWEADSEDASVDEAYYALEQQLPPAVVITIKRMVKEYGNDTNPLLHATYSTMPMRIAAPGELLDFRAALQTECLPTDQSEDSLHFRALPTQEGLSKTQQRKRAEAFELIKQRMESARLRSKNETTLIFPEPLIDDVFWNGLAWLDQDVVLPERMNCQLKIDSSLWHSEERRFPQ